METPYFRSDLASNGMQSLSSQGITWRGNPINTMEEVQLRIPA